MDCFTFAEAVTKKYLASEEDDEVYEIDGIEIMVAKPIHGQGTLPRCLVLDNYAVNRAGLCEKLSKNLLPVTELDLSANQLPLKEVISIVQFMPQIKILNLASNPFGDAVPDDVIKGAPLQHVYHFVLNSTNISWDTLHNLLSFMPSVQELFLSLNNFQSIQFQSEDQKYSSVQCLHFNSNKITEWAEVAKLGRLFPSLTNLALLDNKLKNLTKEVGGSFPNLKHLGISDTDLSTWDEIDNLNYFTNMTEVQMKRIPLLDGLSQKQAYHMVIARLPKVVKLNSSPVTDSDRENAERSFVRQFMDAEEKPARYNELQQKHKNVNHLANIDLKPPTHVNIKFVYEDRTEMREIRVRQTVLQLKKSLKDFACLPPSKMHLDYNDVGLSCGASRMSYPSKMLYSYNMRDCDEIYISKKN